MSFRISRKDSMAVAIPVLSRARGVGAPLLLGENDGLFLDAVIADLGTGSLIGWGVASLLMPITKALAERPAQA